MQKAIIGKKIGMTQIFDEKGVFVPVTVIEAGPCVVTAKKTVENDGYASVQLGYGDLKPHKVTKPMKGFFDKNGVAPKKTLKEFRFADTDAYNVGDLVKADVFTPGDKIDVTGKSKGKGTAGVIKRWNFQRLKETHGTGPCVRHGGSIGAYMAPSDLSVCKYSMLSYQILLFKRIRMYLRYLYPVTGLIPSWYVSLSR